MPTSTLEVRFTRHAEERMREHGILLGEVIEAVVRPERIYPARRGRRIHQKCNPHYCIRVVLEEHREGDKVIYLVITAYRCGAHRYAPIRD